MSGPAFTCEIWEQEDGRTPSRLLKKVTFNQTGRSSQIDNAHLLFDELVGLDDFYPVAMNFRASDKSQVRLVGQAGQQNRNYLDETGKVYVTPDDDEYERMFAFNPDVQTDFLHLSQARLYTSSARGGGKRTRKNRRSSKKTRRN